MSDERDRPDPELVQKFNDFVQSMELDSIAMNEVNADLNREAYNQVLDEAQSEDIQNQNVDYDIDTKFEYHDEDFEELLLVVANYSITVNSPVDRRKNIVKIDTEFLVQYETENEMTDELFEPFKDNVIKINVWPYFRTRVHTLTNWFGIQELVLPTERV